MKKKYLIISLLVLFIIVTVLVFTNNTNSFDNTAYNNIISIRNNFWDVFFTSVTILGNTSIIIILVVILLILLKDRYRYLVVGITAFTALSNQILKNIFRRPRPEVLRLIKQGGYAYPSGHAMISVALYGFLIYYVHHKVKNKYLKIFLISVLSILIILIGISRIYVGVHYPSDILGGYILSLLILILIILGVDKYDKNGSK